MNIEHALHLCSQSFAWLHVHDNDALLNHVSCSLAICNKRQGV